MGVAGLNALGGLGGLITVELGGLLILGTVGPSFIASARFCSATGTCSANLDLKKDTLYLGVWVNQSTRYSVQGNTRACDLLLF